MSRRQTTTKVFVGSLPGGVTTDDLRRLFAPYGPIAECDIANRCGFLHLEDKDLAFKAIEELNNTNFMGTRISVEKGRVKPPKSRRGESGGPVKGGREGRERAGPYARGDGFRGGPPPPRNGSYGRYEGGGGMGTGYEGDGRYAGGYERAVQPREYETRYDEMGDRRPPYDDRYMADRRSYNGYDVYDRRPGYPDARPPYPEVPPRGGYEDDRRIPPGPTGYDDRRSLAPPPPTAPGYDRAATAPDMYNRRDAGPKPLIPPTPGYGDRTVGTGYSAVPATPTAYGSPSLNAPTNMPTTPAGYATGPANYSTPAANYGAPAPGVYGDTRGAAAAATVGYGAVPAAGGYGDAYAAAGGRAAGYDTAYPPLPQQRGYGSGSGPGTGPRRDMSSGRRY